MGQFIDFNYVKQHADFGKILAYNNINLEGSGDERRCCCPFHDDKKPSMTVNLDKGVFCCHAASCGEEGNVLEFVAAHEDTDLRSAAQIIGDICHIDLAPPQKQKTNNADAKATQKVQNKHKTKTKKHPKVDVEDRANAPLSFSLTLDPEHEYGASRSLSSSVISRFEMGYCGRGSMSGRWCVPIHNPDAEVVAYIGRFAAEVVPDDEEKYKLPKGFHKDLVLFNLHRIDATVETVVIVEGVFDAIRLHELNMPAVALLGSSISDEQVALLLDHGFNSAVVLLDGNAEKAERKLVHRVSRVMSVRSVALPDEHDPASVSADFLRARIPVSFDVS